MDRKRKRQSGPDLEWTATRCQRLLRPIASRIAPLRRLSYITDSQRSTEDSASSTAQTTIPTTRNVQDNIKNHQRDPAWFPGQDRRAQIKKYSSRARLSQSKDKQISSPQACLVMLPTPFKARALRRGTPIKDTPIKQANHMEITDSPIFERKQVPLRTKRGRKDPFTRAPIAKQSAELQNRQNYEKIFELHQGVSDGFSLLLQRTAPIQSGPPIHKGVPSLLKMCLRRVPDYIQAEEQWRKSIDEDDETDVCAEVYEELEDLSSASGHGWPGLRDVVIAHGVKLVGDIIKDQLVSRTTRAELAMMPLQYGLSRETEELSLAYAHSLPFKRPFDTQSPLFAGCLSGLEDIGFNGALSARKNVYIRILDDLFNSGRLRLSWLASRDMVKFSGEMIRSLASQSRETTDVVNFIYGRISMVSSAGFSVNISTNGTEPKLQMSVSKAMISIITVLTAIVLIERGAQQRNGSCTTLSPAETLLVSLGVDVLGKTQNNVEHQQSDICFAILTSNLILATSCVSTECNHVRLCKEGLLREMLRDSSPNDGNNTLTMTERAANIICDLSRCCGQSISSRGQECLESLVKSLLSSSESGSGLEATLLKQIALEASLSFAKSSATQQSRQFMETVESGLMQKGPLSSELTDISIHQASSEKQGMRWEEGLCEWIAATPLAVRQSRDSKKLAQWSLPDLDEESEIDDSGYFSSIQATPAPRRKKVNMSQLLASPDVLGMDFGSLARPQTPIETKGHECEQPRSQAISGGSAQEKIETLKSPSQTKQQDTETATSNMRESEASTRFSADDNSSEDVVMAQTRKRKVQGKGTKTTRSKRSKILPAQEEVRNLLKAAESAHLKMTSTTQDADDDEDELSLGCRSMANGRSEHLGGKGNMAKPQSRKPLGKVTSRTKSTKLISLEEEEESGDELGF